MLTHSSSNYPASLVISHHHQHAWMLRRRFSPLDATLKKSEPEQLTQQHPVVHQELNTDREWGESDEGRVSQHVAQRIGG